MNWYEWKISKNILTFWSMSILNCFRVFCLLSVTDLANLKYSYTIFFISFDRKSKIALNTIIWPRKKWTISFWCESNKENVKKTQNWTITTTTTIIAVEAVTPAQAIIKIQISIRITMEILVQARIRLQIPAQWPLRTTPSRTISTLVCWKNKTKNKTSH